MGFSNVRIADIEKKIVIWDRPDGYSEVSKINEMDIDYNEKMFDSTVKYARDIVGEEFVDIKKSLDTFTYLYEIENGFAEKTYTDKPFIIPYLVESSKGSVILLSGGGFAYKTIHGSSNAGGNFAKFLNKNGYSAFVLDYRTSPYKFPFGILDLQRAIRYIRYKSQEFKIDPSKITCLGFSAGGFIASIFVNKYMGKDSFSTNYIKDEIDKIDDTIVSCGYVYPALSFNYNVPMLSAVVNQENLKNNEDINKNLHDLHLANHINPEIKDQFISYSNADKTCDYRATEDYIKNAKKEDVSIYRIFVPGEDHGYSNNYFMDDFIDWLGIVFG